MDVYCLSAIKHKTGTEVPRSLFQPIPAPYPVSGLQLSCHLVTSFCCYLTMWLHKKYISSWSIPNSFYYLAISMHDSINVYTQLIL